MLLEILRTIFLASLGLYLILTRDALAIIAGFCAIVLALVHLIPLLG